MDQFLQWVGPVDDFQPTDTLYAADFLAEHPAPAQGTIIQLFVDSKQLTTKIVLVDAATWTIPAIGVSQEGYAHGGFVGSIADLLEKLKGDIDMMRSGYTEEAQVNIDEFLSRVDVILRGDIDTCSGGSGGRGASEQCQLTITDPSGLSCVLDDCENNGKNNNNGNGNITSIGDDSTLSFAWGTVSPYTRGFVDNDELGLVPLVYSPIAPESQSQTAQDIAQLVANSQRVVCISGAGISVESGIPPFRSRGVYNTAGTTANEAGETDPEMDSIWGSFDASRMTLQGFNTDDEVAEEWWEMKHCYIPKFNSALPNPAHTFFSFLQNRQQLHQVVTQNIDSLHQKAGVPDDKVLELHGHMRGLICSDNSSSVYNPAPRHEGLCPYALSEDDARAVDYYSHTALPRCPLCHSPLRTETVFFGQPLPNGSWEAAVEAVGAADLLFVIGTSLIVKPVNTLPEIALRQGTPVVMINLDDTQFDRYATALVREPAGVFLADVMGHML
jgi:NAD-dependent deacetylase